MKKWERTVVGGAAALCAMLIGMHPGILHAEYPDKPIKLYVGFAAGGSIDTTARSFGNFAEEYPEMNGVPFVIVNKPGGSGLHAAKVVKDSDPNGYTIQIINTGTFSVGDMMQVNSPVDPRKDFTSLGCLSQSVTSLLVHADSPYKDAAAWVKDVKEHNIEVRWSNAGASALHTLIGHLIFDKNGIKNKPVPFKGGSKARAALVAQKVDVGILGVHLRRGFENDIRPLGVALKKRDPVNPDVPTFEELGLPGLNLAGLICLWGPKGMPEDVANKLRSTVKYVAGREPFDQLMRKSGLSSVYTSAEDSVETLNNMYMSLAPVIEKLGLRK